MKQLNELRNDFETALAGIATRQDIATVKSRFLGNKGSLSLLFKDLKSMSPEQKREFGPQLSVLKAEFEEKLAQGLEQLVEAEELLQLEQERLDVSHREKNLDRGYTQASLHPVTIVTREVEDIFLSMGFEVLDGPHIETDHYNFEALNIPSDHPARDMQDTFWFKDAVHLLRTHTSAVQVRGMESHTPPFKFIAPGKVFRCERTDASHEMIFHQVEGMMVGPDVSVSHLIYFMRTLLQKFFGRDVTVRLRPGFFPFVEPGFELDIQCLICGAEGCSVCKHTGWLELLPCGMVHPKVLQYGNIDPEKYTGFAFGLGLDRLVMMRYGIDDIRLIHSGDLRFISQFSRTSIS
jgi:phenylalanyl-tRNA synthetase alpha chain